MSNSQTKWLSYCRMTCLGGSENGECPCRRPEQCELQGEPDYEQHRRHAIRRLWHACAKHTAELETTVTEVNANFSPEELAWFRRPLEGC